MKTQHAHMMRPRRGLTVLSAALLITVLSAALLTMPAGAVVNPVNPRIPNDNLVTPEIPKVKKVCLHDGGHGYEFEVVQLGRTRWLRVSLGTAVLDFGTGITVKDAFTYVNHVWTRDDDEYVKTATMDVPVPRASIANFYAVCRRTDSATQAAVDSSTAWQQVVNATSYAAQTAAWNRWHSQHCVTGGSVNCGATFPTLAETCALYPDLVLSTGEDCSRQ